MRLGEGNSIMKIACNLSTELMELIDEKKVSVDFVKVALTKCEDKIPSEYINYGQLLLHGVGEDIPQHTGVADLENVDWQRLNGNLAFCNSTFFGIHCGTYKSDWKEENVTYSMIKGRMSSNIKLWKEKLKVKLLIENVPYTPYYEKNNPKVIKHSVSPKLISELCNENNIGLLLDIAHAKVAASGLGISLKEYLQSLPLDRVKEIHTVGTRNTDVGLRDNHLEMVEEDYEALEYVLTISSPEIVTLEYGGFGEHYVNRSNKAAIERQLNRITQLVKSTSKT